MAPLAPIPNLAAIVLCGGQSRRMGQPKAWLPFGDEVLLQRVVRRLQEVATRIVVVRAPGQTLPHLPAEVLVVEDPVANRGPVQGIVAGLEALEDPWNAAFVSPTDAPFVEPALVGLLHASLGTAYDLVVPHALGRHHPLAAIYTPHVLPEAKRMLAEGDLRLMNLLSRARTLVVEEDALRQIDPRLLALSNLNTPADYRAALAEVRS